jgi:hypothetical protein
VWGRSKNVPGCAGTGALLRLLLGLFHSVVVGQIRANSLSAVSLIDMSGAVIRGPLGHCHGFEQRQRCFADH